MARYKKPFTLYKRGKYWYYRTYDEEGLRTHGISTGKTSKGAATDFCNQLYLHQQLLYEDRTLRQYAEHFLDDDEPFVKDRSRPLAENTLMSYRRLFNSHILPKLGNMKLSAINYSRLKVYRTELLESGLSSKTVTNIFSILKVIIISAYHDGIINKNPFEGLRFLEDTKKTHDAFTVDEVKFMYSELRKYSETMGNFVLLLALTGMRISEAWGIMPEDILEDNGQLYIHLTRQFNLGKYKPLKNKKSRDIPITKEIKEIILFPVFSTAAFYRQFVQAERKVQDAEERNLSVHSLRHFFITNTKAKGINPLKVEAIAGHTIRGIEGVYTNFKGQDLTEIYKWQTETLKELLK